MTFYCTVCHGDLKYIKYLHLNGCIGDYNNIYECLIYNNNFECFKYLYENNFYFEKKNISIIIKNKKNKIKFFNYICENGIVLDKYGV